MRVLKDIGTKPFLFDSPVVYTSPRDSEMGYLKAAADMGFSEENVGCAVVISNESIKVKGKHVVYEVCKTLTDADGVLVLSHVKGHECCGFGGAIKNLGMGAQSKETKGKIHEGGEPVYVGGCTLCGECAKNCPENNIRSVSQVQVRTVVTVKSQSITIMYGAMTL